MADESKEGRSDGEATLRAELDRAMDLVKKTKPEATKPETTESNKDGPLVMVTSAELADLRHYAKIGRTTKKEHLQKLLNMNPPGVAVTVRAADVVVRKKSWLWEGHLLRGALELLTGVPGLGKSQIQCHLVACATTCLAWPDGAKGLAAPVSAIMITAEDALDQEVVPRLIAAGADLDRVHILKYIRTDDKQRQFLLAEDLEGIKKAMARIGDVGLITIDPITAFMGGKMDSHKVTEVRSQLGPLKDFTERVDVSVSAITHPSKNPGKRAIDHFIASQAFIAAARIGHACFDEMKINNETGESQPTGRVLFTHVKHNPSQRMATLAYRIIGGVAVGQDKETGEAITSSHVVWEEGSVNVTADEAAAAADGGGKKENPQTEVREFLAGVLADGKPVPVNQIMEAAEQHGFSKKQIRTAGKGLGVIKAKMGYDEGWGWKLPEGKPDELPF
jgi:hypothetical protein